MSLSALYFFPPRSPDEAQSATCSAPLQEFLKTSLQAICRNLQAICNGKSTPFAMQDLPTTGEKPPAQEQWEAMKRTMGSKEKTMRRTMATAGNPGQSLRPAVRLETGNGAVLEAPSADRFCCRN